MKVRIHSDGKSSSTRVVLVRQGGLLDISDQVEAAYWSCESGEDAKVVVVLTPGSALVEGEATLVSADQPLPEPVRKGFVGRLLDMMRR